MVRFLTPLEFLGLLVVSLMGSFGLVKSLSLHPDVELTLLIPLVFGLGFYIGRNYVVRRNNDDG